MAHRGLLAARLGLFCATLLLGACGGGGGGGTTQAPPDSTPPPVVPPPTVATISKAEAARFLTQATFGPTMQEIDTLTGQPGDTGYANWVQAQFDAPVCRHLPLYNRYDSRLADGVGLDRQARMDAWFECSLTGADQLRQRVAFALSEIMVVSENGGGLNRAQDGLAWYYDLLLDGAFGNFRTLIENVTLTPVMGRYLSMLGNQKPDAASGLKADENFAREVMQLFTIGLAQLNPDGTPRMANGQVLPAYTQDDIENLARVFTGWWFAGARSFGNGPQNYVAYMVPYENFHDRDAKRIVGNVNVPAGLDAASELDMAMDALANHPNVGPFIGRQLIQKLVTSNPSPAYVARVAQAFNDNGSGVRGDMKAVVRAVLLDTEARLGTAATATFGKPREPLLTQMQLWRAFGAVRGANGRYTYNGALQDFGQAPLASPSVFNFFSPFYAAPGAILDTGLVSPEFQLANESSIAIAYNRIYNSIYRDFVGASGSPANSIRIDLAPLVTRASDPVALVDYLNGLLLSGQMPDAEKSAMTTYLDGILATAGGGRQRGQEALYLVMTSPYYLVQK
ncbi:MAG: DUF1800 domain-containing protein [Panacagrimonas sp.]